MCKQHMDNSNGPSLLALYEQMLMIRRFESAVQKSYRNSEIPGFIHLYIGQEAVAVGVCSHLGQDDWITSTHRGHGHALAKGVPPKTLMAELYGKAAGCCGGRGGSMHVYSMDKGLFGTSGVVGGGIPIAVGLGISAKIRKTGQIAVAFFGDGAVSHGIFHESMNFAGIQKAPVIFVCENNLYATCTPLAQSTLNTDIAGKAVAYGIPGLAVDGNDVLEVCRVMGAAAKRARSGGGPTLIEAKTYRFVGHHEGDRVIGTYRSQKELDQWQKKCPLLCLKKRLLKTGTPAGAAVSKRELEQIEGRVEEQIQEAVDFARRSAFPKPSTVSTHSWADPLNPDLPYTAINERKSVALSWLDAVRDGIAEEMRRDPNIVYLGEGIGERNGSFGHTKNLWKEFGPQRVIDTPISELGFTGAGIGLSASGCRSIVDLMFADLLFEAGSQIIHQAAKLRYMSNGRINVPLVIRSMQGTIKNAAAHHSGNYYPMFAHCPGLIVAVPSNPGDAKGLFKTALRARDPVVFMEHKALLSTSGPVPAGEYFVPFGRASIARSGNDLTVVSCGLMVKRCLEAAESLSDHGISCEVIDLRTIVPLDLETIVQSLRKTGRILVVDEAFSMCGIGAEIAASVMELAFDHLDAPIGRVHTMAVASPFSPELENAALPNNDRILDGARLVLAGEAPIPFRPEVGLASHSLQTAKPVVSQVSIQTETTSEAAVSQDTKPSASTSGGAAGEVLKMPNVGLTVTQGKVIAWLIAVGEPVNAGQIVLQIETDKAVLDIESPLAGTLAEILAPEGTTVELNQDLGIILPE